MTADLAIAPQKTAHPVRAGLAWREAVR